jgi:hypothetical protein
MEWLMTAIFVTACIGNVLFTRHYSKCMHEYKKEMLKSNKAVTITMDLIIAKLKPESIAKALNDMYNRSIPNKE